MTVFVMVKSSNKKLSEFIETVNNRDQSLPTVTVPVVTAVEAAKFIAGRIEAASRGGAKSKRKPVKTDRASELNRARSKRHYDKKRSTDSISESEDWRKADSETE